jgi:hypothetical protein
LRCARRLGRAFALQPAPLAPLRIVLRKARLFGLALPGSTLPLLVALGLLGALRRLLRLFRGPSFALDGTVRFALFELGTALLRLLLPLQLRRGALLLVLAARSRGRFGRGPAAGAAGAATGSAAERGGVSARRCARACSRSAASKRRRASRAATSRSRTSFLLVSRSRRARSRHVLTKKPPAQSRVACW